MRRSYWLVGDVDVMGDGFCDVCDLLISCRCQLK